MIMFILQRCTYPFRRVFKLFRPIFMSSSNANSLSGFLALNRTRYLKALEQGNAHEWTIVMGNEAGDLDSFASSIAYSYLASTLHNQPTIAILQTLRNDLKLRPENLYAYEISRINPAQTDLLCIDDIPPESLTRLSSSSFALVDHNRLTARFSASPGSLNTPNVVAIIDHHEDEGSHKDADPRLITVPVGSCSSLVTQHFMESWKNANPSPPRELASLILCAIFIDTYGLKPGGKAVPIDHDAVRFLLPKSTFTTSSSNVTSASISDNGEIANVIRTLDERKKDISHLSSRDLLRRDYKEYSVQASSLPTLYTKVGLATVPLSPKSWLHKEASPKFWESMDGWMNERGLDVLGVLCTYNSHKNGKHKRQDFFIIRDGRKDLKKTLFEGLEASDELQLERRDMEKRTLSEGMKREPDGDIRTRKGSVARLWKQGNSKASRKVVGPRVKEILENL